MDRRNFFVKIIKFGSLFLFLPSGKILSELLSNEQSLDILDLEKGYLNLPVIWENNIAFGKIKDLAKVLNTNYYENKERKKIVLYYRDNRFTITSGNNFVKINGKMFQMPYEAKIFGGEIYVPIEYFLQFFNKFSKTSMQLKEKNEVVSNEAKPYSTVENIRINSRDNGLLIEIKLSRAIKSNEVGVEFRNDWLYVDMYKTKIDMSVKPVRPVKDVKIYKHKELASVAFLLERKKWRREVWVDSEEKNIKIILIDDGFKIKEKKEKNSTTDEGVKKKNNLDKDKKNWYINTIIIDPGHGGKDPGAIGYRKLKEKNVVLAISKNLRELIARHLPGVKVLMTRDRDVFIPLKERTHFANANNGKLFISIHANSLKNSKVNGFETYFLGPEKGELAAEIAMKENSVVKLETEDTRKEYEGLKLIMATLLQNAHMHQSEYLAKIVQQEMEKGLKSINLKSRGVKQANFWVMVGATMPNILVETGFISNKYDAKILKTKNYQLKIAKAIFNGIKRFKEDTESVI